MSVKIILSILSILTAVGILFVTVTGCNGSVTNNVPVVLTKPDLPLLDTETHGSEETAYFALG
jgi:hypothetical protein